jgi:hypothetical protein
MPHPHPVPLYSPLCAKGVKKVGDREITSQPKPFLRASSAKSLR